MVMANTPLIEVPSPAAMPVTTGRSEQIALRLPHGYLDRARTIREALTRPGLEPPNMAEIQRAIFGRGLEAWEAELGIKPPAGTDAPKKTKRRG